MLIKHWNLVIFIITLFDVICAPNCTGHTCYVRPGASSFAEQVIEAAGNNYFNRSFTILAYAGNYNTTNGNPMNFINFTDVAIKKHPDNTMPVNIMCPGITIGTKVNGVGFENSMNIKISGLNFMNCGIVTSGLYFNNTFNITIRIQHFITILIMEFK